MVPPSSPARITPPLRKGLAVFCAVLTLIAGLDFGYCLGCLSHQAGLLFAQSETQLDEILDAEDMIHVGQASRASARGERKQPPAPLPFPVEVSSLLPTCPIPLLRPAPRPRCCELASRNGCGAPLRC